MNLKNKLFNFKFFYIIIELFMVKRKFKNQTLIKIWKSMSKKEKLALILFIMLLILTERELDGKALRPSGKG